MLGPLFKAVTMRFRTIQPILFTQRAMDKITLQTLDSFVTFFLATIITVVLSHNDVRGTTLQMDSSTNSS